MPGVFTIEIIAEERIRDKHLAGIVTDLVRTSRHDIHILAKPTAHTAVEVALCVEGKLLPATELWAFLRKQSEQKNTSRLRFYLGGADGLPEAVKRRADLRLSVSGLTFPHQLFRVMLVEMLAGTGEV